MDHTHSIAKVLADNAVGSRTDEAIVDLISVDATVIGGTFRVYVPKQIGTPDDGAIYEVTVRRVA